MNQPASKDPSMDEILSSIRQIIADDEPPADEVMAEPEALATEITADEPDIDPTSMIEEPAQPVAAARPQVLEVEEEPLTLSTEQMLNPPKQSVGMPDPELDVAEDAPLALSTEQMLNSPSAAKSEIPKEMMRAAPPPEEYVAEFSDAISEDVAMVVPDDIAFISDDDAEGDPTETDLDALVAEVDIASLDEAFVAPEVEAPVFEEVPAPSPLPDPTLTTQMSDELLEPTTQAAAKSAFGQLDALTMASGNGQTVEDLIREMLRPMLKGWLDENLPGVVEKLVQREIERVSRGNR